MVISNASPVARTRKRFQPARTGSHPLLPTLTLDADACIRAISPAARALLGYGSHDRVDTLFFTHVHGRHMHQVMHDLAHMAAGRRKRASWLLRLRTGRGRFRWYWAEATNHLASRDPRVVVTLRQPK